jgi:hypothetical protein
MSDPAMIQKHSRRRLFGLGAATALAAVLPATQAKADATISKDGVGYQDVPSGEGKVCAQCLYYIPIAAGASLGGCQLVTGPIAPGGWCQIWAPKAA